jgi:hypothetical protein
MPAFGSASIDGRIGNPRPVCSVSHIAMKMQHWISIVLTLLLAAAVRAGEHTEDSLDTVKKNLAENKAVLIDVREAAEWKRGHLRRRSSCR